MKKEDRDFYSQFKRDIAGGHPPVNSQPVEPVNNVRVNIEQPRQPEPQQPAAEAPKFEPVAATSRPESEPIVAVSREEAIKQAAPDGNGHKPVSSSNNDVVEAMNRRMEADKERAIPGNRYIFNREKKHLLETARLGGWFQLHNFVVGRLQNKILKPDFDLRKDWIGEEYIDGMLEGSIAIDGMSRSEFTSLIKFKEEERTANNGGLFSGPPR